MPHAIVADASPPVQTGQTSAAVPRQLVSSRPSRMSASAGFLSFLAPRGCRYRSSLGAPPEPGPIVSDEMMKSQTRQDQHLGRLGEPWERWGGNRPGPYPMLPTPYACPGAQLCFAPSLAQSPCCSEPGLAGRPRCWGVPVG